MQGPFDVIYLAQPGAADQLAETLLQSTLRLRPGLSLANPCMSMECTHLKPANPHAGNMTVQGAGGNATLMDPLLSRREDPCQGSSSQRGLQAKRRLRVRV